MNCHENKLIYGETFHRYHSRNSNLLKDLYTVHTACFRLPKTPASTSSAKNHIRSSASEEGYNDARNILSK